MSGTTGPMPDYEDIRRVKVTTLRSGVGDGLLFVTPQSVQEPEQPHGLQIVDDRGRVVWYHPLPAGQVATNLRVQRYRGEPVLTWWQGWCTNTGVGRGVCYIADTSYRVIATVTAGGGEPVDLHEMVLTDRGTVLLVSYQEKSWDLSSVGGDSDARVHDSVVEEVDVATGEVLLHWSGVEHIGLRESGFPVALAGDAPWDHLHVNSVAVDDDENLVITARATQGVYKVDRRTGEVLWKLGSGFSTFVLGVGVRCSWPHDGQPVGNGVYRIFDNGANLGFEGYESRVVWVRADPDTGIAEHVRQVTHPDHVSVSIQGGSVELPNGNLLVGWGSAGRISEFSPDGELLLDAEIPEGVWWSTYRVFRSPWHGQPIEAPSAVFENGQVHAVWNGATGVDRWRLLVGSSESDLHAVDVVFWDGFDTAIKLPSDVSSGVARVVALDHDDQVLGTSELAEIMI